MNETTERKPVVRDATQHQRLHMWGITVTILLRSSETGGRYSVIEYISPPTGLGPPLHFHRQMEESFHILEGTMQFQVGDQRITVGPGAFVHVPAQTPHAFWNASGSPVKIIGTMSPGGFEEYLIELSELASKHPELTSDLRPLIAKIGEKYDQVVVGPPPAEVNP
jgi:mannose-6-phosphate isomerase-like protein (cupin superfamily)